MTMASSPCAVDLAAPGGDVGAGQGVAPALFAHVMGERAAAARALGHHHLDAMAGEQADGRLVDRRAPAPAARSRRAARRVRGARLRPERSAADRPASGAESAAGASASIALTRPPAAAMQRLRRARRRRSARRKRCGIGQDAPRAAAQQRDRATAADRSPRYARGHDRPDACSARPRGRWSCRRGRRGSGRYARDLGVGRLARSPACP